MDRIGLTGSTGSLGKIIYKNKKNQKIFRFKGDIRNKSKVFKWIYKNDLKIIIHLAAIVPIKTVNENKKKAKEVNYLGTKNVVDASLKKNIKWFFFSSTSHVYNSSKKKILEKDIFKPISYYGKTKSLAERYIIKKFEKKKIPYCIGRIFSTTSSDQKKSYLIPDLKERIKKNKKKIILKNLNHYRDFISMQDISKIIFKLSKKKYKGILNIASGKKIYLKNIAKIILRKYNKKNYEFIDNNPQTSLIGDTKKLKKITNFKSYKSIEKMIFH
jgi:UDP-glucose 4-epimerase